jgi:hypothetical protein
MTQNTTRGFPRMFGSTDCMHWTWNKCSFASQEMYIYHKGVGSVVHGFINLAAQAFPFSRENNPAHRRCWKKSEMTIIDEGIWVLSVMFSERFSKPKRIGYPQLITQGSEIFNG